jgi:uncharacterized membrane protein YqjE
MTERGTPEDQSATPEAGFVENARLLAASVVAYMAARLRLAGIESGEAGGHFLKILLWGLAALLAALLGYLLLLVSTVFLIARWTGWNWEWVLLAASGAHFLAVLVCALAIRGRLHIPVFPATLQEFKRDQEWLTSTNAQRRN